MTDEEFIREKAENIRGAATNLNRQMAEALNHNIHTVVQVSGDGVKIISINKFQRL